MKTVYDLIRHRSTLEVICGNCDDGRVFNHRFLMSQFGAKHYLAALKFRCRRCGARRSRLRIVADSLGEPKPLKMQHFGGVYKNSSTRSGRQNVRAVHSALHMVRGA